jgi:hypothetical protein
MKKGGKIVLALLVIALLGFAGYQWVQKQKEVATTAKDQLEQERGRLQKEVQRLEEEVAGLKQGVEEKKQPAAGEDKVAQLFGPEFSVAWRAGTIDCEQLQGGILYFFNYLDAKGYAAKVGLSENSQTLYNRMIGALEQQIPKVPEMPMDFDAIAANTIHLFRALGEKEVELGKEIVAGERENLETILAVFYRLYSTCEISSGSEVKVPSGKVRYDYAAFFLTTTGGKAYLFRRDSRLRVLATYYGVLALHEANEKIQNPNGIDIRPALYQVMEEISARNDLADRTQYLGTLGAIKAKYPAPSGDRE